jgi:hypothetical protein
MRKTKRFNINIVDSIIGKDFDSAKELCQFNGYRLSNDPDSNLNYKLNNINYELDDKNIIISAKIKLN